MTDILNSKHWFTQVDDLNASAVSYKIKSILHSEQTPIQHIEIIDTECFGNLMVFDGYIKLTGRDNFLYHEMLTQPAMFTHPDPKNIVIIGGGDCGSLQQILQHETVKAVTQIEIDKRVTELSELYFPELCTLNKDPRADILFGDGLQWLHKARSNSVDIIIIDTLDPIGVTDNPFNKSFYKDAYLALDEQGILVQQLVQQNESPLHYFKNIFNPVKQTILSAGFDYIQTLLFPQSSYPYNWCSCLMASKNLPLDHVRKNNILNKGFTTKYYNLQTHMAALAIPEFLKD